MFTAPWRARRFAEALDQTSWDAASDQINAWTASGEIGVIRIEPPTIEVLRGL
jgi:hypothetical protein